MLLRLLHDAQASGPYNMTAPLLRLAMGERASLLLEGQKVLPGKMTAAGYRFQYSNLADALGNLFGK